MYISASLKGRKENLASRIDLRDETLIYKYNSDIALQLWKEQAINVPDSWKKGNVTMVYASEPKQKPRDSNALSFCNTVKTRI